MATAPKTQIMNADSDRWAYDISQNVITKGEVYDVAVINQSIENILMTMVGERIFNITYGSNIMRRVFETITPQTGEQILNDIVAAIKRWDNRVRIIESEMHLTIDEDNNSALIEIPYQIISTGLVSTFKKKIVNY